ncbi:hypothetical protein LVJ94_33735 [Pendulispora rubella]|uniref:Sigma-70 family RNA polymerase sigma factor n=1 Tax=Pendulispora rubella TaxID=2741070 RepID=A0ABZ2KT59_9BACT
MAPAESLFDETQWTEAHRVASAAWPEFRVTLNDFREYVEARQNEPKGVGALDTTSLYLACACALGHRRALDAFERMCAGEVEAVVQRLGASSPPRDDALQMVWLRLFGGERPKILAYGGKSALKTWVRIVALRTLLNQRRTAPVETLLEGHAEADLLVTAPGNPELDLMRAEYGLVFREALVAGVRELDIQERLLLRFAFVDGLSVRALGKVYGVHPASAARWLRAAHGRLAHCIRVFLRTQHRLTESELTSVLCLASTSLDTSIVHYLE